MIAMMEELLTPEDVAKILRTTEYNVRELLKSGQIQGFKLGSRWKIRPEALRRYIQQLEQNNNR